MLRRVARIDELFAVWRDVELLAAANREWGSVECAGCQIAKRAAPELNVDDVRACRVLPRLPVAVEKAGDHARFGRPLLLGFHSALDAGRIDAAVRIDVRDNHDAGAIRHPSDASRAALKIGHLAR